MGAILHLDISNNSIVTISGWMKPPRQGLQVGDVVDEKTITSIYEDGDVELSDFRGIIALANAIRDNGAMTSLNLANNSIGHRGNMDGIQAISSAVKVLAVILVPFLCPSEISINCWCLLLSAGYEGDDEP
jgi:hypothetical protein